MVSTGEVTDAVAKGKGLGYEGSGVITEIGPGVSKFAIGDRVIVSSCGCFKTYARQDQRVCTKIPDSMSFEEAATMSAVYITTIHTLMEVARLRRGQTILIHFAAGGLVIAAIRVAKMIGAVVSYNARLQEE